MKALNSKLRADPSSPIPYEGNRPNAYRWTGSVDRIHPQPTTTTFGGAYIKSDFALRHHDDQEYKRLFWLNPTIPLLNSDELLCRNMWRTGSPHLDKFVKVALISRWGYTQNFNPNNAWFVRVEDRNAIECIQSSSHHDEGSYVAVVGIAEEGVREFGVQNPPHYTLQQFNNVLHYAFAHELGHLILYDQRGIDENMRRHPGFGTPQPPHGLMGSPPGRAGISVLKFDNRSRSVIDLQSKEGMISTNPSAP